MGPPGVGKTTLAKIIAKQTKSEFVTFSAVPSEIKEIKKVMENADQNKSLGIETIVFVDEIHRFNGETDMSFVLPFMSVVLMMTTFSYDAYNKWDAYVIALPNGRKNSIKAKYIATIILLFIITMVVSIFTIITTYVKENTLNLGEVLQVFLAFFFNYNLVQGVMYPVIYKFGLERARIGIFVGVFGLGFLGSLISKFIDFEPLLQHLDILNHYWIFVLPIVSIIILYVSYKISEKIYQNREF